MATAQLKDAVKDLLTLQPDPLEPAPESVERYVAALQLAFREAAEDGERQAWIKREVWNQLRLARARESGSGAEVRETLERIFRLGSPPTIDGFKPGIALGFAGLGPLDAGLRSLTRRWMPWLGKRWDAATHTGVNHVSRGALPILRPLIRRGQYEVNPDGSLALVPFRLWVGPGEMDPDREVLKIDYDIDENKGILRSVLDEQIEIVPDVYLGKALLKLRGRYRMIVFFANRSPQVGQPGEPAVDN